MSTLDKGRSSGCAASTVVVQCAEMAKDPPAGAAPIHSNRDKTRVASDWLLWQLADSAFPAGGFAHSGGLEAAWHHGEVPGASAFLAFIEASLWQVGNSSLPFVSAAYERPEEIRPVDDLCHAFLSNHVANRGSQRQGRSFLSSVERTFAGLNSFTHAPSPSLNPQHCHLAPIFGWCTRRLRLDRPAALRLFLHLHLRGLTSSAVRLGIVGPLESQTIQAHLAPRAEEILSGCGDLGMDDIAQTAPLLDIWQGSQDRLYSRLFQS